MIDYEFYPTPAPFTRWLFRALPIGGQCAETCVGSGAICDAAIMPDVRTARWKTNDLDPRWPALHHLDATKPELYQQLGAIDWHIGNPAFTPALEIIEHSIAHARVGVAMHLRASIHEVLKTGPRRTWMVEHPPTGILWLPRFGYQRSKKTGEWSQDSVCACWVIWLKAAGAPQFIRYAPEWVLDELKAFTPAYRREMDKLMLALDPDGYAALLRKAA